MSGPRLPRLRDFGRLRVIVHPGTYEIDLRDGKRIFAHFWRAEWHPERAAMKPGSWEARLLWLELRWGVHR